VAHTLARLKQTPGAIVRGPFVPRLDLMRYVLRS
jgi:hypothetical protein